MSDAEQRRENIFSENLSFKLMENSLDYIFMCCEREKLQG